MLSNASAAADECGIPRSNIFVFDLPGDHVPDDFQSWEKLLSYGKKDWLAVEDVDNTTAGYFSTSGTSGLPKAAIVSHSYLTSQGQIQANSAAASQKVGITKEFILQYKEVRSRFADFLSCGTTSLPCLYLSNPTRITASERYSRVRDALIRAKRVFISDRAISDFPNCSCTSRSNIYVKISALQQERPQVTPSNLRCRINYQKGNAAAII